eukprot:TRINITY_DN27051_c0_g1_i1.p1 TRINITY_DN27051_c0_g1~~TRINITY_DN27051_c0_g1_i1.p1  ORF type:complete len:891 (+),score=175.61 TRINITY_DN27051_c0_g1_i1:229-2673(+)
MRRLVADRHGDSAHIADLSRLAQTSVGNRCLARLFHEQNLQPLLQRRVNAPKEAADVIEAMLWELQEVADGGDRYPAEKRRLSRATFDCILEGLMQIGRQMLDAEAANAPSAAGPSRQDIQRIYEWLAHWSVGFEDNYTHSSLRGGRDRSTNSGRLRIPDVPQWREAMYACVIAMYERSLSDPGVDPLCWVEMTTQHYPFFEDIDIMGSTSASCPLENEEVFWQHRATVLHALFPSESPLVLTLYTASGFNAEKQKWKGSYHAVWNNCVVDRERANVVRLATLDYFHRHCRAAGPLQDLEARLQDLDPVNVWEAVFDAASVKGGSFRMPWCDKINRYTNQAEGRPIKPCCVMEFHFDENGTATVSKTHGASDLDKMEWLRRGAVRLCGADGSLPDRTSWRPPKSNVFGILRIGAPQSRQSQIAPGSSFDRAGRARSTARTKKEKEDERWTEEQRARRRAFRGTAEDIKQRLDKALDDPEGHESTIITCKAREGQTRFLWSSKRLRGAIDVTYADSTPNAEVFVRGNQEQQLFILEILRDFTEPWTGRLPKKKPAAKPKRGARSQSAMVRGYTGGGYGGRGLSAASGRGRPQSRHSSRSQGWRHTSQQASESSYHRGGWQQTSQQPATSSYGGQQWWEESRAASASAGGGGGSWNWQSGWQSGGQQWDRGWQDWQGSQQWGQQDSSSSSWDAGRAGHQWWQSAESSWSADRSGGGGGWWSSRDDGGSWSLFGGARDEGWREASTRDDWSEWRSGGGQDAREDAWRSHDNYERRGGSTAPSTAYQPPEPPEQPGPRTRGEAMSNADWDAHFSGSAY